MKKEVYRSKYDTNEDANLTRGQRFKRNFKLWVHDAPEKFVLYVTLLGTVTFVGFMDFNVQRTTIKLQSHIAAANKIIDSSIGLVLFLLILIGILQAVNAINFKSKKSPISFILFNLVTLGQIALVIKYCSYFILQNNNSTSSAYNLGNAEYTSMIVMIAGAVFFLIASVLSFFFVDWKYVRVKDE